MKLKRKIQHPKLVFFILLIVLFAVFLLYYFFVFSGSFARNQFANEMIDLSDENEKPIFAIQKLQLYSNANVIDNSDNQSLENMNICQYTDLSIYLNNSESSFELTEQNTIKELYIDNILLTTNLNQGTKILNYKNALNFGKYTNIETPINDRIDFKIINTNEENENHNYDEPTFYTDCSNPITLGYLNKDILTNYSVTDNVKTVSFNGKILKEANISLDDIKPTLNFTIHIVNNSNQKFAYNMKLDIDLNDANGGINTGYVYRGKTTSGSEYRFFKEAL